MKLFRVRIKVHSRLFFGLTIKAMSAESACAIAHDFFNKKHRKEGAIDECREIDMTTEGIII